MANQPKQTPTKAKLFWRTQGECWRRMVTPFLMYLFMSLIAFALQIIKSMWANIIIGSLCILAGAAFNAYLCYQYGKQHFDYYLTGALHRKNELFGIRSGGDHCVEKEYRPWKGFYIGFLVGVPVLILGVFAAAFPADSPVGSFAAVGLLMIASWSILPVSWLRNYAHLSVSFGWSMAFIVLPVLVSGIFYLVGAHKERELKAMQRARQEAVEEAAGGTKKR